MSEGHHHSVQVKAPGKIGPYSLRGNIGEGAFSIVKLAFHNTQQKYYACKIVPKSRLSCHNLEARFEIEIRINQQLHHPGIVELVDILKDDNNYYVFMEFCPNGELFQYIVDRKRLKEEEARNLILQILDTIHYIHKMGVSHRDLKPENILLDQLGRLKISDFGLSKYVDKNNLVSTPCGSPCYASPECISGKPYNGLTNDVWSCGVILYAMVTGQLPWTKRNQTQLFEQIRKGEYTVPSYVSPQCKDLIDRFMEVDSKKRITVEEAFEHPFLYNVPKPFSEFENMTIISLKRVDQFFNKDKDFHIDEYIGAIKRPNSMYPLAYEAVLSEIVPNNGKVVVRKRAAKTSKSTSATKSSKKGESKQSTMPEISPPPQTSTSTIPSRRRLHPPTAAETLALRQSKETERKRGSSRTNTENIPPPTSSSISTAHTSGRATSRRLEPPKEVTRKISRPIRPSAAGEKPRTRSSKQ